MAGPAKPTGEHSVPEEMTPQVRWEIWEGTNLGKKQVKGIPERGTTCAKTLWSEELKRGRDEEKAGSKCGEKETCSRQHHSGCWQSTGKGEHFLYPCPNLTSPDPEPSSLLGLLSFPEHSLYQPVLCSRHCDKHFIYASILWSRFYD